MDEKQFVELLDGLLQPDTERVKTATASLKKNYYTSPASLTALIHILTSSPRKELRQLAAVEARKLVGKHWPQIPSTQKPEIRTHLFQATLNEEGTLVRHSSARVIAAIAGLDLSDGDWADLPGLLQQAATSQNVRQREVGVYIIFALMETMGDFFIDNLGQFFSLFSKTLLDPESPEVRINTMLSLSRMALLVDAEEDASQVSAFQQTIPGMVQVLKDAIASEDEGHVMQAYEVFQTLLSCDAALLNKHFGDLVQLMLELSATENIDDDYRAQALSFLMQCVRYRKLKVQGLRVGEQMTITALKIVTELGELSADDEDITPARSALGLLDILASSLPPSQVVVPLLKAIGPYVSSNNPDERRAGILALGMCVEGAPDFIATQLPEILPMVLHLLQDSDVRVRSAALNGVARLSDDLAEDVAKEHTRLIPALINNFDLAVNNIQGAQSEQNLDIVRGSCNAIDSLIEGLEEEDAARYVAELVPRFSGLFSCEDYKAKAAAIGAVGSIASATGKAFMPYFDGTMQALGPYVSIKDSQDDLELRGVVGDAMGKIATAVGAEAFEKYVGPLMQASEEALHLDHPRLRETSYILWSTMAKVYEEKFSPYLDGVVRGLQECLKQEEADFEVELGEAAKDLIGQEVTIGGQKVKVAAAGHEGEDDDFEDMDDEDDDFEDIGAVTAIAMEKEIAAEVIGDVVTYTRKNFLPYIQQTVETLLELVEHSYEGVRKAAIGTLFRTYACLWGLAEGHGMEKWQPGLPLKTQPTEDLVKLGNLIITKTLELWGDEMDRGTVTDINRNLAATLKLCGPAILVTENGMVVAPVSEQLVAILTKRHTCQQDFGEELGEEILDESSEYDWLVVDTALDAVAALAAALGPAFAELWQVFEKPVLKYVSSQEAVERTAAVGTIAECIDGMGEAVTPYTASLMKAIVHRLSDEDPEVKSNAAYASGVLVQKSTDEKTVLQNLRSIFVKVEPMFDEAGTARLRDNAAGAISRMIMRYPKTVPLGDVLPRLVSVLPLREDYEENKPVFEMIVTLYQANEPTIQGLTPQIKPVLEKVLSPPEEQLEEETRAKLVELVGYLQKQ